eukprot:CAMPEP_0201595360 /NCGR_PEP_ID=MMETSP0190_2-20130828/192385_1 /ASSEMBLY_ACC=CAM_ASM_000263 /TAXON_ID=37353 /ORGANISM="Rosalina sp." /LENGTH=203 /DNA_ID=CAMNT_0048055309 /DNA_START=396 /DNA_END=1003 /DNA_ORIENTATION=+
MEFNDTWIYLKINNDTHINEARPFPALSNIYNQKLDIWMSTDRFVDRPYENYNATLRDITIQSWDSPTPEPTTMPTTNPTQNPTNEPSGSPTAGPTHSPSMTPINTPTVYLSESPTLEPTLDPISNLNQTIYPDKEIDIFVNDSNEENDLNENENQKGISQQSIYFFIIGALLASICCVCMIGTSLGIICYIKRKRKHKQKLG